MPNVTAPYPKGTPCWVDLMVPDQQAALDFYRDLFGWGGAISPPETDGYVVCTLRDKAVAGIGRSVTRGNQAAPPTAWTTYLATDDADATARSVSDHGGTVLAEPQEVPSTGRMLVAADPSGAVFGVWQPLDFFGAQVVNEPGALCWNELNSRSPQDSATFYAETLGVDVAPSEQQPDYSVATVGDRPVAGLRPLGDMFPPDTPSNWLTYFAVDDTDSTVAAAVRSGASLLQPASNTPAGRLAVLRDPQGGVFAVITLSQSAPGAG